MLIDHPDTFKAWLVATLKPICDADPDALSKYVLALVRKDLDKESLHKLMVEKLYVFTEEETEQFVTSVIRTIDSKGYLNSMTPLIPNANPPNPSTTAVPDATEIPIISSIAVASTLPATLTTNTATNNIVTSTPATATITTSTTTATTTTSSNTNSASTTARHGVTDSKSTFRERRRYRSGSRGRSRSRSWDRSRRASRSPRPSRRSSWRNKSPPSVSSSVSVPFRGRRTARSPLLRSRSRSPNNNRYRSRYRSRNTSPKSSPLLRSPDSPLTPAVAVPSSVNTSKRRCRDFDEKGYCMRGEMCPFDHGVDPVVLEDAQLSSVLTYSPNTTTAMAVPPPSTVTTEQQQQLINTTVPPPTLLTVPPQLPPPLPPNLMHHHQHRGPPPPSEYNPQAPHMWNHHYREPRGGPPHRPPSHLPPHVMVHNMLGAGPPPPMNYHPQPPPPIQQRELIQIPVMDQPMQQQQEAPPLHNTHSFHQLQFKRRLPPPPSSGPNNNNYNYKKQRANFDFNRLGPRSAGGAQQLLGFNCSLELKKVPQGLNTITHLNNHFAKFGKPLNIQVNFNGDAESALITFSTHAEANAAYRSTEAVLNNRFIKVFWYNTPPMENESVTTAAVKENIDGSKSIKTRLGVPPQTMTLSLNDDKRSKKAVKNKEENKAQVKAAIIKGQELLAAKEKLKRNQDEQRKQVLNIKKNLQKRKQELLEKQLTQQKILIEKMEKLPSGPQRDIIMDTIKKTQDAIETIKKDIVQTVKAATVGAKLSHNSQQQHPVVRKAVAVAAKDVDVQRELLDTELDLMTKRRNGGDITDLQRKLRVLKVRAALNRASGVAASTVITQTASLSSLSMVRISNNSGTNAVGQHFIVKRHLLSKNNLIDGQKHAVDRRPTKLLVSGYEGDEQSGVMQHFQTFGEIVDYTVDETLPSVTLNYKSRKDAELALAKGKQFQDRTLQITWALTAITATSPTTTLTNASVCEEQQQNNNSATNTTEPTNLNNNNSELSTVLATTDLEDPLEMEDADEEETGEENLTTLSEEQLLQDDEEEDDENEDRSWRR